MMIPKTIWPVTILATTTALLYPQQLLSFPENLRGEQQEIAAISPYEISAIAKEVTVIIRGPGSDGSGTIIGRKGNKYFVLTAAHVVDSIHPNEEADVEGSNRRLYPINTKKIIKISDVDLAVIEFTSDDDFRVVEIGDSENLQELATVYVAGYPLDGEVTRQKFNITEGKISSLDIYNDSGYDLVYTNITRGGMSGGPVLNDNGQLIGIHGRAEGTMLNGVAIKAGFNLGIPIKIFLTEVNKLSNDIKTSIVVRNQSVSNNNARPISTPPPIEIPTQTQTPTPTTTPTTISTPINPDPPSNQNTITDPEPVTTAILPDPYTTTFKFLNKFKAEDGTSGDTFGNAVAMKGNYALIAAANSDSNAKTNSGTVYIFDLNRQRQNRFIADDGTEGNLFGNAIAIDGQYALIGSPYNDRKGTDSGLAYVFDLKTGKQSHRFTADDNVAGDLFGSAVALQGKYAVIGAPHSDPNGHDSGSAYLFDILSGKELYNFIPAGGLAGDLFGSSVAMDGKYALIASPYQDVKGVDSGAVYLFDITTGKQLNKLMPNDGMAGDVFGYKVKIKGQYALISALYSDAKGVDSGAVYLFNLNTGTQVRKFVPNDGSPGDGFGYSIALGDRYAVVGAAYSDAKGVDSGAVYVFDLNSGRQLYKLTAADGMAGDLFGYAVAMEGKNILIGSAYDDEDNKTDNGTAYLFDATTGRQITGFQ